MLIQLKGISVNLLNGQAVSTRVSFLQQLKSFLRDNCQIWTVKRPFKSVLFFLWEKTPDDYSRVYGRIILLEKQS